MNPEDLREITAAIEASAEKGTKKALVALGVDIDNPLEVQKDLAFARKQRQASEQITTFTKLTIISLVLSGLGTVLFFGFKDAMK